jgi:thiamine kinase-like enzyme
MNEIISNLIKDNLNWEISDISIEYQKDGLTNQNYIISKDNIKYAIRISGKNSYKLGINRYAELAAMKAAAAIGVGAEIIYFSTETGNMITKYIEGKKWSNEDAATSENISRIADTLRKVHHLSPIPYEFCPYKDIENRIQFSNKNNLELPDYLDQLLHKLYAIKQEREKNKQEHFGLCHNDPFPNNFIDDGTVRLLDWEYTGMGDIFFDLSSACMFYSQAQKEEFLQQYFGQYDIGMLKSLEQMTFVVSFWNALWAVLQTEIPEVEHDYKTMAQQIFRHMKES